MIAIQQFAREFPENTLKDSMVCDWKVTYSTELKERIKEDEDTMIKSLPVAKVGYPLMVGAELDKQI